MPQTLQKDDLGSLDFANRLKELRKRNGYSQRELAKKTGLHHGQYGRYERGDSKPYAETLTKIADALQVSVDYLLEGVEEAAAIANLEDRDLLTMFTEIEKLDSDVKDNVKYFLDAVIIKNKIKQMSS